MYYIMKNLIKLLLTGKLLSKRQKLGLLVKYNAVKSTNYPFVFFKLGERGYMLNLNNGIVKEDFFAEVFIMDNTKLNYKIDDHRITVLYKGRMNTIWFRDSFVVNDHFSERLLLILNYL